MLTTFYHSARTWLGILPAATPNTLVCASYNLLVSIRLIWWIAVTALVAVIDRPGIAGVVHCNKRQAINFLKGLAIGLVVMAATVLTIVAVGAAQLHSATGSVPVHFAYGVAWLTGEIIGAAGEELLFRGLILVLTSRLVGIRTAMVVSALAFSLVHGANPGASYIWMIRLGAAGLLLAYSVIRSGSLWWAIGYHAGWNFSSAPLFGAAGSGYIDQGHLITFLPTGSDVITGGAVGPEGSAIAFVAVVIATGLLFLTIRSNELSSLKVPAH